MSMPRYKAAASEDLPWILCRQTQAGICQDRKCVTEHMNIACTCKTCFRYVDEMLSYAMEFFVWVFGDKIAISSPMHHVLGHLDVDLSREV